MKAVINTVALRESEHGLAFAKRIDELGYSVRPKHDPKHAERMAIAASTALSDKEKFEAFSLGRAPRNGARDIFDTFFENKDLDPVTGGLLGRYVAEERDSGRKPRSATPSSAPSTSGRRSHARAAPRPRRSRGPRPKRSGGNNAQPLPPGLAGGYTISPYSIAVAALAGAAAARCRNQSATTSRVRSVATKRSRERWPRGSRSRSDRSRGLASTPAGSTARGAATAGSRRGARRDQRPTERPA